MPVCDWERTITCPYNPSHQITVERIQWHLVKCRKSYPSSDHVICPFNASHHVPRPEKEYHMSVCSDRKMVEMEKYSLRSHSVLHQQGNVNLPPPVVSDLPPCEEDWEKEATVRKSYDPSAKAKQSAVLRELKGATPSQRREFRAQERERLDLLNFTPFPRMTAVLSLKSTLEMLLLVDLSFVIMMCSNASRLPPAPP